MLLSAVPEIHGRSATGVSHMSSGQASPTAAIAAPPASNPRTAPGRSGPHPGGDESGHDQQRSGHLRLEAEPDRDAGQHHPTRAPVLEPAHHGPHGGSAAERQQRVRVVMARDRDRDRREHKRQAGDEAGHAAEPPAHQVVDQRHRRDAHRRLRHEQAPRAEAEHARGQRLDPQRQRRLVDGHHAGCVERAVQEGVPAGAHRAYSGAVVLVGEAVAVERPQVEDAGQHEQSGQLGAGNRDRESARSAQRERRHALDRRRTVRERPGTSLGVA